MKSLIKALNQIYIIFIFSYLQLLEQLTEVGGIDEVQWIKTFEKMRDQGMYYIVVIEDAE